MIPLPFGGKYLPAIGNAVSDLGYGVAQGGFKKGFGIAAQRGQEMQPYRDAESLRRKTEGEQAATRNASLAWVEKELAANPNNQMYRTIAEGLQTGALDPAGAFNAVLKAKAEPAETDLSKTPQGRQQLGQQYGLQGEDLGMYVMTGNLPGNNQSVRAGLGQPVPLRNKTTGETVPFMPMSDGTYINPLSQQIANEEWEFDPAYIAAQRAQGTQLGKEVGAAQFDLPAARLTMQQSLDAINDIRTEKAGMAEQFGKVAGVWPQQMAPVVPGTERAKFQVAVDRGVNRAFLEAREVLRGGGQITDFESRKAESAITNMQSAMERGDQAQFEAALADFEQAVKDGYAKLQSQAGTLPSVGGQAAPTGGDAYDRYGLERP